MAISGRRQQVLDEAVATLQQEGIRAIGLQACALYYSTMLAMQAGGTCSQDPSGTAEGR